MTLLEVRGLDAFYGDFQALFGLTIRVEAGETVALIGANGLTVEENLMMGALNQRPGSWTLSRVYDLFPVLGERRRQMPNSLSGGQQHMVAIGRALMSNPKLLLCDEISLGLAPVVVDQIYQSFAKIRSEGASIVLVEQDVKRASGAADRVYCLLKGRVTLEGPARRIGLDRLSRAYFGT